ncbi:DUF1846 domain-containing protein [Aerococcaceae bacterium DSM 111176]|nr:DUF1846 domain-containing protein [Aerococcaceae bacterium DSM 111176]
MIKGFDSEVYLKEQSSEILSRVSDKDKLYLEFGGKLIGDMHAKRVLPGFDEDVKLKLLTRIKDDAEVIICVYAGDIEQNKVRGDYGITYDQEVLRLIDEYRERDILVNSVLLTRYSDDNTNAKIFKTNLERRDIRVYTHEPIKGYPLEIDALLSNDGFEKNEFIETSRRVIIVTGPGAGSGKLATCLSQLYHEHKRGNDASYAKFETFPVWNLPLKHPVNVAYEAATIDLNDTNVIDNYHFEAYDEVAINYNRDVQMFPAIRRILKNITGEKSPYKSPTDMGVNCIKSGIIDDEIVQEAARQEIIRRYFQTETDYKKGTATDEERSNMHLIMDESELNPEDRTPVVIAREYEKVVQERLDDDSVQSVIAIELPTGKCITGRRTELMDASSAVVMNALKKLAGINDRIDLLAPMILETIQALKMDELGSKYPTLTLNELLIALAISAVTNPTAKLAYDKLGELVGSQAHSTVILSTENEQILKRLGIDTTSDPVYLGNRLSNVN